MPTVAQQRVLAVAPKISGGISSFFSLLICFTILTHRRRRKLCYHRILCGISMTDALVSFFMFLSTWPMPTNADGVQWAVGNRMTCRLQAFFIQFGIASPFYNASLAIYYWLVSVRGWKEVHLHRIEWFMHVFPLTWGLTSALTGLFLDVYDSANLWCWCSPDYPAFRLSAYYIPLWVQRFICTICCVSIYLHVRQFGVKAHLQQQQKLTTAHQSPLPSKPVEEQHQSSAHSLPPPGGERMCIDECEEGQDGIDDSRDGSDSDPSDFDFHSTGCMSEEEEDDPYEGHGATSERRIVMPASFKENLRHSRYVHRQSRRLRKISRQCFWYAGAFYINYAALTVTRLIQIYDPDKIWYPLVLAAAITVPIQGLPNFLIYLRPKLLKMIRRFVARHCCVGRQYDDTPPWWYLGKVSPSPGNSLGTKGPKVEEVSSAGIVNANQAVLNDASFLSHLSLSDWKHSPKQNGETVLVVVDTAEGGQWCLESHSDQKSLTTNRESFPNVEMEMDHKDEQDLRGTVIYAPAATGEKDFFET